MNNSIHLHSQSSRLALFTDEPLDSICETSDVIEFVLDYTVAFDENEVDLFSSYVSDSGLLIFAREKLKDSSDRTIALIVGTLKYSFSYDRLLMGFTAIDGINALGLPHLIEASSDLDCAVLLLANRRYKIAMQTLRSALECAIVHVYFSISGVSYDDLNERRIHPMKDKKRGMLNYLVEFEILQPKEAEELSFLYGVLSSATHSEYKYLDFKFEDSLSDDAFFNCLGLFREVCSFCIGLMLKMNEMRLHGIVNLREQDKK